MGAKASREESQELDQRMVLYRITQQWQRTRDIHIQSQLPLYRVRAALNVLEKEGLVIARETRWGVRSVVEWKYIEHQSSDPAGVNVERA